MRLDVMRAPPARCRSAVLLLCALRLPALAPRSVGVARRVAASAAGAGAGEPGALDAASLTDLRFGPSLAGDPLERLRFAMILYSRVHGSSWLDVPPGFVAPDDWPEPVRGLALGKAVAALVRLEAAARGGETRRSATSPDSGMETATATYRAIALLLMSSVCERTILCYETKPPKRTDRLTKCTHAHSVHDRFTPCGASGALEHECPTPTLRLPI